MERFCLSICASIILLVVICVITKSVNTTLSKANVRTQDELRKMLVNVGSVFNDHDMHYWIDFGTLLGIVRENDIILGDNDIDLCINDDAESHKKMLGPITSRLKALGYAVTKESWSAYRVWKGSLFADIYITSIEDDTIKGATGPNSDVSKFLIGNPKNIYWKLSALNLKAPENIHEVLVWRYGTDYMTPKPGFKGRVRDRCNCCNCCNLCSHHS